MAAKTVDEKMADEAIRYRVSMTRLANSQAKEYGYFISTKKGIVRDAFLAALADANDVPFPAGLSYTEAQLYSIGAAVQDVLLGVNTDFVSALENTLAAQVQAEAAYYSSLLPRILPEPVWDEIQASFPQRDRTIKVEEVQGLVAELDVQGSPLSDWPMNLTNSVVRSLLQSVRKASSPATQIFKAPDPDKPIISTLENGRVLDVQPLQNQVRGDIAREMVEAAMDSNIRYAETLTKTAIGETNAKARDAFVKANGDLLDLRLWSSVLDTRTSALCISRDNLVYDIVAPDRPIDPVTRQPVDGPRYGKGPGRLHYCCRSTEIMTVKDLLAMGINNPMPLWVSAQMNGKVMRPSITYREWLERQPVSVWAEVMGRERAELVRSGKVALPDIFTADGDYMNLDLLKQIHNIP